MIIIKTIEQVKPGDIVLFEFVEGSNLIIATVEFVDSETLLIFENIEGFYAPDDPEHIVVIGSEKSGGLITNYSSLLYAIP